MTEHFGGCVEPASLVNLSASPIQFFLAEWDLHRPQQLSVTGWIGLDDTQAVALFIDQFQRLPQVVQFRQYLLVDHYLLHGLLR